MILDLLKTIKTFILDVDGVLTTGDVQATDAGEMQRTFNIKDGFALQFVVKSGYHVIVISGGNSEGVKTRLQSLGIKHVHMAVANKRDLLIELKDSIGIDLSQCLYIGDDYPDLSVMRMCGIKVAPADAAWEVQEEANIVTRACGGQGAVREILEKVLKLHGKWESSEHSVW